MAFPTTSFIPYPTIRDMLQGVILPKVGKATTPDAIKCALYGDTATFDTTTDPLSYTATGECTGTNWAAGGVTLSGVTNPNGVSVVAGVGVMLDDTGNVSVASTTIATAVKGCLVYDDTLSPKAVLAVVYFGNASGYTTNNGTFGITWDTNGIWRITLHN